MCWVQAILAIGLCHWEKFILDDCDQMESLSQISHLGKATKKEMKEYDDNYLTEPFIYV